MGRPKKIDTVKAIAMFENNVPVKDIAKKFGVGLTAVRKVLSEVKKDIASDKAEASDFKLERGDKLLNIERSSIEKQQTILDSLDTPLIEGLDFDDKVKLLKALPLVQKTAQDGSRTDSKILDGAIINWTVLLDQASEKRRDRLKEGSIDVDQSV